MKWKFCQCCCLNGHCENQDRGHRCETYPKQLEDKVERLQKQLDIATKALKRILYERDERAIGDYLWIANNALKEMENV